MAQEYKQPFWEYTSKAGDNPYERMEAIEKYTGKDWGTLLKEADAYGGGARNALDYIMSTPGSLGEVDISKFGQSRSSGSVNSKDAGEGGNETGGVMNLYKSRHPATTVLHESGHLNDILQIPNFGDNPDAYNAAVDTHDTYSEGGARFRDLSRGASGGGFKHSNQSELVSVASAYKDRDKYNFSLDRYSPQQQEQWNQLQQYRESVASQTPKSTSQSLEEYNRNR
jgi:hypothetical protein